MAWPKGKPRKVVPKQHAPLAEVAKPDEDRADLELMRQVKAESRERIPLAKVRAELEPVKSSSFHRAICAYRVRRIPIPRDLRIHDYMPLARIADTIRDEMAAVGAPDSEVEAFVARHVPAD